MNDLQPLIDRGYYTVPLSGELKRDFKGKKTLPIFEARWKARHSETRNLKVTPLGGILTGQASNLVAIDCDDTVTSTMFRALDPEYPCVFEGVGKLDASGEPVSSTTILYQFEPDLQASFVRADTIKLDYYANNGFIYAATVSNKTKIPLDPDLLDQIKPMPSAVRALLEAVKPTRASAEAQANNARTWQLHLQPQVENMVLSKHPHKPLFKLITPKDFRDLSSYVADGWLHPDDVPEGRGSEYLSKVSAILGADQSIDEELYLDAMHFINSLFSSPMPTAQFEATILDPMVEARANIDGVVIWQYNEEWQSVRLSLTTKRQELLEVFYDANRMLYYITNPVAGKHLKFDRFDTMYQHIEAITPDSPKKPAMKRMLPLVDAQSRPECEYGFFDAQAAEFNTFKPTNALAVFRNPEAYAPAYKRPVRTIQYIETLIPEKEMRDYVLGFLKRKFMYFEYSPVVLYFMGVAGSGKDTLFHLISRIIGDTATSSPSAKEFLELYNGYMLDTYFVQLDEYGNQLTKYTEKEQALGKLKAYTGKQNITVRMMRTDGFAHRHNVTFVLTANKNPLTFDADDRRVAYCDTPNKLGDQAWVREMGGLSELMSAIDAETQDFAYWLATDVKELSKNDYMQPPNTAKKRELIASMYSAGDKLAYMCRVGMFDELREEAKMHGFDKLLAQADLGIIYEYDLFEYYLALTDDAGTKRGLSQAMREFAKWPTTKQGMKAFKYDIPKLREWALTVDNVDAISGDFDSL